MAIEEAGGSALVTQQSCSYNQQTFDRLSHLLFVTTDHSFCVLSYFKDL